MSHRKPDHRGFTITELLVAIALIIVLLGLLLPALGGVWSSGEMTRSMNNMRQISLWMRQYSTENNDLVLPARFNYIHDAYPGKVRSNPNPQVGSEHEGTWSDILTTVFEVGVYPEGTALPGGGGPGGGGGNDYRFDSPDRALYDLIGESSVRNPFRSTVPNTWDAPGGFNDNEPPKPYGKGAQQRSYPGFFAANMFFDTDTVADPAHQFRSNGQIRFPDQSMYLVDSFYGETIEDAGIEAELAFNNEDVAPADGIPDSGEVDFRYGSDGICLMLFLDGHVDSQSRWQDLSELRARNIRVQDLDRR